MAASPNHRPTTHRQPLTAMADALVEVLRSSEVPQDLCSFQGTMVVRASA